MEGLSGPIKEKFRVKEENRWRETDGCGWGGRDRELLHVVIAQRGKTWKWEWASWDWTHSSVHPSITANPSVPSQSCRNKGGEKEKKGNYSRRGLQSEALGLLALSRIISIINSLSFQSFVSIFTFGEQGITYAFTASSPFNVCHLSACEEKQWNWISLCW